MRFITGVLRTEYRELYKLNYKGRMLIKSVFLYNTINPIYAIFINAFLWRQSHDITILALFNLAYFGAIPFGSYLSGKLLKIHKPSKLYLIGSMGQAITVLLLIFFPITNYLTVSLFGMLYGIWGGLYWSMRNLLSLKVVESDKRIYFSSLEFTSSVISNIIIPLLIGSFIVFGEKINLYSSLQSYYLIGFIAIIISFIGASKVRNLDISIPDLSHSTIQSPSNEWMRLRAILTVLGLLNSIMAFLPTLLILSYIGKEDALGTVQSLSAIIAAITMYSIGRAIKSNHRFILLGVGIAITITATMVLSLTFTPVGIITFIALFSLAQPLIGTSINSLNYDLIEHSTKHTKNQYAYIFDNELFLGAGRLIGILFFLYYATILSSEFAIRYTPLLFGISQLLFLIFAKSIEKNLTTNEVALEPVHSYTE